MCCVTVSSPGICHPVITTEAQLSLSGTEGGAGLRDPAPPHVGQSHVRVSETGALQHLTHIIIIPVVCPTHGAVVRRTMVRTLAREALR